MDTNELDQEVKTTEVEEQTSPYSYSYRGKACISNVSPFSYSYTTEAQQKETNKQPVQFNYAQSPVYNTTPQYPPMPYKQKNKIVAGILGIILGYLGVHNFYLGFNTKAVIQIVLSILTLGLAGIWGFIEGVLYLTGAMNIDANGIPLKE